ncbi:MAG: methylated-DNA-[protein]-cysteine S-methyltransferase [Flavobacteriales bacterium]|jgi:methylated-DNA-[protein]-cysteine S-methyltransferase
MKKWSYWESPLGCMEVKDDGFAIKEIAFAESRKNTKESAELGRRMMEQLEAYFSGDLDEFNISLSPEGSEFQMKVWAELQKIPFGMTRSNGQLARILGDPKLSRAVGLANGKTQSLSSYRAIELLVQMAR